MRKWKYEIDVADLYAKYENSDIDGHEMITALHKVFRTFVDSSPSLQDESDLYRLEDAVDELSWTDTVEDADCVLQSIYDIADDNRIWIKTF